MRIPRLFSQALVPALGLALACASAPVVAGDAPPRKHDTYTDDFSSYKQGSDGSPRWYTSTPGWLMHGQAFRFDFTSRSCALLEFLPKHDRLMNEGSIESEIVIEAPTGTSKKGAGILLWQDEENHWQLALIEFPDGKHGFEFFERLNGKWHAQSQEASQLAVGESTGDHFAWEYNHPYVFRIAITPRGITGDIREKGGTLCCKKEFLFSAPAVRAGKAGLLGNMVKAEYKRFTIGMAGETNRPPSPPYAGNGYGGISGNPTGYFHIEKVKDAWWFIDPNGKGFYPVGLGVANYDGRGYLKTPVYQRATQKKYGSEETWAQATSGRLHAWGFNALDWGGQALRYKGMAHTVVVNFGHTFASFGEDYGLTALATDQPVPNVFHPQFEAFCDKTARQSAAIWRNSPWLLGYYLDNELGWWGAHYFRQDNLFNLVMKRGPTHSAKIALIRWFEKRYGTIEAMNRAWAADRKSFDEIARVDRIGGKNGAVVLQDKIAFSKLIADKYFSATSASLRKHDPNHMILGCRICEWHHYANEIVWEANGKYCDVISINNYGPVNLATEEAYHLRLESDGTYVRSPLSKLLADMFRVGGKPIMICEWAFNAYDSGHAHTRAPGMVVDTQAERAKAFSIFQTSLFAMPFVVGSAGYYQWTDNGKVGDTEDANYGLVNENDEPYELLTETAAAINPLAAPMHDGKTIDIRVSAASSPGVFIVTNAGSSATCCRATVRQNGVSSERRLSLPGGGAYAIDLGNDAVKNPGGHYLAVEVTPDETTREVRIADNSSYRLSYTPGLSIDADGIQRAYPLVIGQHVGAVSGSASLTIALADIDSAFDWRSARDRIAVYAVTGGKPTTIASQIDLLSDGGRIVLKPPVMAPATATALFVCVMSCGAQTDTTKNHVSVETGLDGYEIVNGMLRLRRRSGGNAIFDEIYLNEALLGSFLPEVKLMKDGASGEMAEVPFSPNVLQVSEMHTGPLCATLDIAAAQKGICRIVYRIEVPAGACYFSIRPISFENMTEEKFRIFTYGYRLPSSIAGDSENDVPQKRIRWYDPSARIAYGAVNASGMGKDNDFYGRLTLNEKKERRSSVLRFSGVEVKPHERYAAVEPPLYIAAAKGDIGDVDAVWKEVELGIRWKAPYQMFPFLPERWVH